MSSLNEEAGFWLRVAQVISVKSSSSIDQKLCERVQSSVKCLFLLPDGLSLTIIECPSLSLLTFFVLRSILSDISTVTPVFLYVLFAQYIFFHPFNICVSLNLKYLLWQCIVEYYYFIQLSLYHQWFYHSTNCFWPQSPLFLRALVGMNFFIHCSLYIVGKWMSFGKRIWA